MADPGFLSATQLCERIRKRRIGVLEALDHYIARIERFDGAINAVVVRDFERARIRARALDRARSLAGPLHGLPMTVKESFDVAGLPTTWGVPGARGNIAATSALAVERLEAAGAVVFGKTNVPLLLLEWQSFNAVYGTTNNPWDLSKTPGGSSGGSAAALAAGLSGLDFGTDIGGSIRVPAHNCGIFGHKPTWGVIPPRGHSLLRSFAPGDISVAGPLARSAADLALAFDVVRGPDPADGRVEIVLPAPRTKRLRGMRVAVWPSDDATTTDPEIVEKLEALARRLEREGAKVDRRARPAFDAKPAFDVYLQLLGAAIGSRLGPEQLEAARARDALRARDDDGTDAIFERSFEISHRAWLALNERRHVLRRTWQAFFEQWDVLVCPAFGTPALPHDPATPTEERRIILDGRDIAYNDLLFWPGIIGAYHLPATVAPLGFTRAGLPVGVQIVGPPFGDRTTLEFARLLERAWLGFTPPPSC